MYFATSSASPFTAAVDYSNGQPKLTVRFRRLLLAHEVNYTLETSDDLNAWSAATGEAAEPILNSDGTVTAESWFDLQHEPAARFFRLRISRK